MTNRIPRVLAALALALGACSAEPQASQDREEAGSPPSQRPGAEAAEGAGVAFDVELIGGEHEGTYRASSDSRCMAIAGDDGQLNVNTFSEDSDLTYGQVSVYDFGSSDGESGSFIFIAKTDPYELRIDTVPNSLVGNAGEGSVSWRIDGKREIIIDVEATGDDGVEVKATVTCTGPSWTGF